MQTNIRRENYLFARSRDLEMSAAGRQRRDARAARQATRSVVKGNGKKPSACVRDRPPFEILNLVVALYHVDRRPFKVFTGERHDWTHGINGHGRVAGQDRSIYGINGATTTITRALETRTRNALLHAKARGHRLKFAPKRAPRTIISRIKDRGIRGVNPKFSRDEFRKVVLFLLSFFFPPFFPAQPPRLGPTTRMP